MSGASGAMFGRAVVRAIEESPAVTAVHLVVSDGAAEVARHELDVEPEGFREASPRYLAALLGREPRKVRVWPISAIAAPIASGSFPAAGMAIVPCSMASVAAIASGAGTNLLHRAAEVTLKERRPLVLAFREAPLGAIHLDNLVRVSRAGATVFPIAPPWYLRPRSIEEMVDQWVARFLHTLGVPHDLADKHRYRP